MPAPPVSAQSRCHSGRRWWACCAAIWVGALLVRLLHLWLLQDSPLSYVLMGDARRYHEWAIEISQGNWIGTESFYQAPLYPYFIGSLYWLLGVGQATVRIAQAILGATSCVLLAYAGRRMFSPKTGLMAGGLLAVYPPAMFFDGIIQKTSLSTFLTCAVLALMAFVSYRPRSWWTWAGLGAVLGGLILTRENALVLAALLPVWLLRGWGRTTWRTRCCWLGLVFAGMLVVLFPVAFRNRMVGGEWHLTTAQFGPNFYIGNSQYATGRYFPLRQDRGGPEYERIDATEIAERELGRTLTPGEVSATWTNWAWEDIQSDWPRWFRLMGRKWFLLWNSTEIIDTEDIYTHADASGVLRVLLRGWHFGVLVPLAFLGIVFAPLSWRRQGVLLLFVLAYAVSVCLFYLFARYRFPLVPPLMLFAAAGLVRIPSRVRRRCYPRLAVGMLGLVVMGFWTNLPGEPHDPMRANTHYMLAVNLPRHDVNPELIAHHYDLAEKYDPTYAEVYRMRANFEWDRGDQQTAIAYFEKCLELQEDFLLARYDYGFLLYENQAFEQCLEQWAVVDRLDPEFNEGWLQAQMGEAYYQLGKLSEAQQHFQDARTLGRTEPVIDRRLARILIDRLQYREAVVVLERLLKAEPDNWTAELQLGNSLLKLDEKQDAVEHWQRALDRMPEGTLEYLRLRHKIQVQTRLNRLPPRPRRSSLRR